MEPIFVIKDVSTSDGKYLGYRYELIDYTYRPKKYLGADISNAKPFESLDAAEKFIVSEELKCVTIIPVYNR